MTMKIITGYTGTKHITPADDAGFHRSIFGDGNYVLHSGSQFAATIQSATEIRIADGELIMQGRHARNDSGYQAVAIANGTQGMYRNDLIVARYSKDASTSVESISLVVITGTASSETASDPTYNTGDIENGETRDFPLYRVKLNGITIDSVEKLWEEPVLSIERGGTGKTTLAGIKSLLGLAKAAFVDLVTVALGGTGKSSHTANAVLTGNGTNPVNNVPTANGAFYATGTNGAAKFGTLPVAQGGTGSTTQAGARSALGLGSVATENVVPISKGGTGATTAAGIRSNIGVEGKLFTQYALNSINIDSTGGNWTVDISESGHGTIPTPWVNVTQTTGAHFIVQTAKKCDSSSSVTGRDQRMWVRDKYSSGVWSNWREVLTEGRGIQMVKLWENSSTDNSFPMQTISISTDYDFFEIFFKNTTAIAEQSTKMRLEVGTESHAFAKLYDGVYERDVLLYRDTNNLQFDQATKSSDESAVNNSYAMPTAIYGIKGVL